MTRNRLVKNKYDTALLTDRLLLYPIANNMSAGVRNHARGVSFVGTVPRNQIGLSLQKKPA